MIERIRYTDDCSVTPDLINIPKWKYLLYYNQKDAVSISYDGKDIVVIGNGEAHPAVKRYFKHTKETFDIRLWGKPKVLSVWTSPQYNIFASLQKVITSIQNNNYKVLHGWAVNIGDINEYSILFCEQRLLDKYIVRCNIQDLQELNAADTYIVSNELERLWHIWTPEEKIRRLNESEALRLKKHFHYKTTCSKWKHKIGNMDVAEWHLYN